LKNENATLRRRIQTLEAEIATLQAKVINVWGTC
jgi:cell division protein FtsB